MSLPDFDQDGYLPPGIHAASLAKIVNRFGTASEARIQLAELLCQVVEAAKDYTTIKRVLIWGSFVTFILSFWIFSVIQKQGASAAL